MTAPAAFNRSYAIVNATAVTMAPLGARASDDSAVGDDDLGLLEQAVIIVREGRIKAVGPYADRASDVARVEAEGGPICDVGGKVVVPGLIDAHTHALFAGERLADFEALAAGRSPPLGISYTVRQTRAAAPDALLAVGKRHLEWMRDHGTTTAELKTGYALDAAGEVRMLAAMAELDAMTPLPHIVATFCGAHALPPEFADHEDFVDELCDRILPAVIETKIAKFADAFCELGFFSVDQSRRFLEACAALGLGLRVHADELSPAGGALLAAKLRCSSADHLNFVDAEGAAALARARVVGILCPTTVDYLNLPRWPPARMLIDGGVRVALATDFNPGTSPCFSLQRAAHLARRKLGMSIAETLAAVTVWPAASLGLVGQAGCLAPGCKADMAILKIDDHREFGYYDGGNLVAQTLIGKA